jgi:hypothetical protein
MRLSLTLPAALLGAFFASGCGRVVAGAVEPAWDRQACEQCRMLLSDPSFSAQIRTRDGQTLFFDDPGCLLRYEAENKPAVGEEYFHDFQGNAWLPSSQAGFIAVARSPMGYRLGAVAKGREGARDLGWARRRSALLEAPR